MSLKVNTILISGNLTRDAEIIAPEGSSYKGLKVSIAHNISYRKGDDWHDKPLFLEGLKWSKYPLKTDGLVKGAHVLVEGSMDVNIWVDQNGKQHNDPQLKIQNISLVETPKRRKNNNQSVGVMAPPDDDIPF